MKRSKESIFLEFSQILNLVCPQEKSKMLDIDAKAFAGFFFDAHASGVDRGQLCDFAQHRWRGNHRLTPTMADWIGSFVESL